MKKYILMFVLLAFTSVYASDVPSYLQDGKITVTLKNGKTYAFSTNEYMVVRRHAKTVVQPLAAAPAQRAETAEVPKAEAAKNAVTLYGGYGPTGTKAQISSTSATFSQQRGAVFGFGYSRKLNDKYSLEGVGLSNGSGLLGVGRSF